MIECENIRIFFYRKTNSTVALFLTILKGFFGEACVLIVTKTCATIHTTFLIESRYAYRLVRYQHDRHVFMMLYMLMLLSSSKLPFEKLDAYFNKSIY